MTTPIVSQELNHSPLRISPKAAPMPAITAAVDHYHRKHLDEADAVSGEERHGAQSARHDEAELVVLHDDLLLEWFHLEGPRARPRSSGVKAPNRTRPKVPSALGGHRSAAARPATEPGR